MRDKQGLGIIIDAAGTREHSLSENKGLVRQDDRGINVGRYNLISAKMGMI